MAANLNAGFKGISGLNIDTRFRPGALKDFKRDLGDFFGVRPVRDEQDARFAEQVVPRAGERLGLDPGALQGIGTERQEQFVDRTFGAPGRNAGVNEGQLGLDTAEFSNEQELNEQQKLAFSNVFQQMSLPEQPPEGERPQPGINMRDPEIIRRHAGSLSDQQLQRIQDLSQAGRGGTRSAAERDAQGNLTGAFLTENIPGPSGFNTLFPGSAPQAAAQAVPFDPATFNARLKNLPNDAARDAAFDEEIAKAQASGNLALVDQLKAMRIGRQSDEQSSRGSLGFETELLNQFTEVTPEQAAQERGFQTPGIRDRFRAFTEDVGEIAESAALGVSRFGRSLVGGQEDPIATLSRQEIEFLDLLANDPSQFDRLTPEQQQQVIIQVQERFGNIEELEQFQPSGGSGGLTIDANEIARLKQLGLQ